MSGGGKTQTSTSSVQIPPEVLARYNAVNARAENVASTPFQAYSYDPSAFVAPMTETQNAAIGQIGQASGMAQPYFQAGAAATLGGMGPANLGELDTNKYMSPYLQNVVQSTADILGQQNRQDMSGALGTAIQSGAGFGDRSGIAAANLNRQQMMGMGSTIGNLLNQGYMQAQGVAQQQQSADLASRQANLARLLQGGQSIGQLGAGAQGAALAGSQALLGAGTQEQQTEQAGKSALYNQYQQERAYPFQTTQFLGNIGMGTGALSGSTTQTTSPAGFFSGLKRGGKVIEDVGYRRGGLVPESMGGHVSAGHMGEGYADGGSPQTDYATMVMQQLFGGMDPNAGAYGRGSAGIGSGGFVPQANLPVGQLMIADPVQGPSQTDASDIVDMASSLADTGEKAGDMWEKYGFSRGGTPRSGLAAGGMPYDPQNTGYVPVQEPGSQKTPELLQPKDPQQPQSGLSKVADLAKIVGMFMANGGVAGRHGYAGGGRPEPLTLEQELEAYARRRPASALFDPGPQNLPPGGVAAPARVQGLSFNPNASVQGGQTENSAYVAPTRVQGLSFNPNASVQGDQTENSAYVAPTRVQGLPFNQNASVQGDQTGNARIQGLPFNQNASVQGAQTENAVYVSPAEAEFLRQLRAAPPNLAVATPAGLSAADADRIRREYYTSVYNAEKEAGRPVQLVSDDIVTNRRLDQPTSVQGVQKKPFSPRVRELPFNPNASVQGAQAENAAYVEPDAATRMFGAATGEDSAVDTAMRIAANTPGAVSDAYMRAVDKLFLGPTEYSQKYPTPTPQPDYIVGGPPAWSRTVGARAEDRRDLVFNPYASVQGAQIGEPRREVMEPVESGLTLPPYVAPYPGSELRNVSLDRRFTGVQPGLSSANYSDAAAFLRPIPMPRLDRSGLGAASATAPVTDAIVAADPAQTDLTRDVANAAEPIAGAEPGLAAGTGAGTPTVATGDREAYYAAIKAAESGNNPNAQSNTSSASGYYGFTDGTWSALAQKYPEAGLTADGKNDPAQQERAIRLLTAENERQLKNAGIPATNGNLYAAHFLGAGAAPRVLGAPDGAAIEGLVPASYIAANPFLKGMTVGEFKQWTNEKSSGAGGGGGGTLGDAAITPRDVTDTRPDGGRNDQPAPGLGGKNFFEKMIDKAGGPENIILPFLSGLGKMAGSQSRFLGTALLEGVGGGAEAYMNRQKQLADIGQTQALTRGQDIQNVAGSVKDIGGVNYVVTANGGLQQFNDWLSNPSAPIAGGEALNNTLRLAGQQLAAQNGTANTGDVSSVLQTVQTAPRGVEGGSGLPVSPSQPPEPTNVIWDPRASGATDRADKMMSFPNARDLITNSAALLNDVTAGGSTAGDNRLNIAEQAMAVSALMGAPPLESFGSQGTGRAAVTKALNLFSQSLGLGAFSDMPTQTDILDKLRFAQANNLVNASNQDSYNALSAAASMMPNIEQDPIAAATVMATLMVDNQRAVDRSSFYNAFADQTTSKILLPAGAEFNRLYDSVYKQEVAYLRDLLANPATSRYIKEAMTVGNPEETQFLLQQALGRTEIPPKLYRYFVSGGNV